MGNQWGGVGFIGIAVHDQYRGQHCDTETEEKQLSAAEELELWARIQKDQKYILG